MRNDLVFATGAGKASGLSASIIRTPGDAKTYTTSTAPIVFGVEFSEPTNWDGHGVQLGGGGPTGRGGPARQC